MRLVFLAFLFLITTITSFSQSKAFPINFSIHSFPDVDKNLDKWHGKVVAFDGVISEIQSGIGGKPFYKVNLGKEFIWIGSFGVNDFIKVGRSQRILGYLTKVNNDAINKKYNSKKYFVLSIAFVDFEKQKGSVFPEAKDMFQIWSNGNIPSPKK